MRVAPYRVRRNVMGNVIAGRLGDGPLARWAAAELGRNDPAAMMAAAAALGRFSSREWIGEVDVPTAVVVTLRDSLVPPHRQRKLAEAIPAPPSTPSTPTMAPVPRPHSASSPPSSTCAARWRHGPPSSRAEFREEPALREEPAQVTPASAASTSSAPRP